jgi:hypothetical protein
MTPKTCIKCGKEAQYGWYGSKECGCGYCKAVGFGNFMCNDCWLPLQNKLDDEAMEEMRKENEAEK